jgi:hypothetical protein
MFNINEIKQIAPNATATAKASITRSMPDTLDEARAKVIAKLQENIAYVEGGMTALKDDKPDLLFKYVGDDTYKIGAKYGNRWLRNVFGDGNSFVDGIEKELLVDVLNIFVTEVEGKQVDDAIEAVMKANVEVHKKKAA